MDAPSLKRRLAAILAADAVGYSKHMARDEEGTLRVLSGHRVIIDGLIATFSGRIVGTAGDSVLAEFGSSVDSVRCAVEIQAALATRNSSLAEADRLLFRIGINLGDVIVEGDDILGDGVNVAARLESIADPGGICVSSSIYDQISGKLNLGFADMGHQSLKNIGRPVRTYMVARDGAEAAASQSGVAAAPASPAAKSSTTLWLAAAGAVGLVVVAVTVLGGSRQSANVRGQTAATETSAAESLVPAARTSEPPAAAEARARPPQPVPAAAPAPAAVGAPAPAPVSAPPTPVAAAAPVAAAPSPPAAAAPLAFSGGTASGACEGDDQLTGAGTVRVEVNDLIVSFPPAAGRRAPVVARGRLADDGGVTLQVVRGGRGRSGTGGSFSGRLIAGRGTLTGPAGRCTITLQLN